MSEAFSVFIVRMGSGDEFRRLFALPHERVMQDLDAGVAVVAVDDELRIDRPCRLVGGDHVDPAG